MLVFYLFRLRLFCPGHAFTHREGMPERDRIGDIIRQRPTAEIGRGRTWRIGNVEAVGDEALLFAVGDTANAQANGDFPNVLDTRSPCTYALYDGEYGILSLALKPALSSSAASTARSLQTLLSTYARMHDDDIRLEIDGIIDPEAFIDHIMGAYAVTEFTIHSGEPNVYDDTRDLHAPMQQMMEAAGGASVRTSILGDDLDREALEGLTRTATGAGYAVSIRIREAMGRRPVRRRMDGDIIDFLVKNQDIPTQADSIRAMARQIYLHIRGE